MPEEEGRAAERLAAQPPALLLPHVADVLVVALAQVGDVLGGRDRGQCLEIVHHSQSGSVSKESRLAQRVSPFLHVKNSHF